MVGVPYEAALSARAQAVRRALQVAIGIAAFGLVFLMLLIEPAPGVPDVHLPAVAVDYLAEHTSLLSAGEPWYVGRGPGRLPQALELFFRGGIVVAIGLIVWGLFKRSRNITRAGIVYVLAMLIAGPVTTGAQPNPPLAVGVPTALRMLRTIPESPAAWRPYVQAQVAYINGDRPTAARLAARINPDDLNSPIMSRYRLQFLRHAPVEITSVCFASGCLSTAGHRQAVAIASLLLTLGLLSVVGLTVLQVTLQRRAQRIEVLRSSRASSAPVVR